MQDVTLVDCHAVNYHFGMTATTVKLEGALLREIQLCKPPHMTLAAYVREALEGDVRRRRLASAARDYQAFLAANPDERAEMEQWAEGPLATPPGRPTV